MRKGEVLVDGIPAGILEETGNGFRFSYYVDSASGPVALTLPRRRERYESTDLFPFFAGLLTEGVNMQIQCRQLKIDESDLFGRLLKTAHSDVIGNVTVRDISR